MWDRDMAHQIYKENDAAAQNADQKQIVCTRIITADFFPKFVVEEHKIEAVC